MKLSLLLGLMLFLSACGVPEVRTPASTPQAIQVIYPTSLISWADKTAECASTNPLIATYSIPSSTVDANIDANDMILGLGEPSAMDVASYLSQVGSDQIVVVVNQDNNISQLSTTTLQSIYSGQISSWGKDPGQQINVWVLPIGDPVRKYFDHAVLQSNALASEAMLAPDSKAMLLAISDNPNAIGYLAGSILASSNQTLVAKVKIIQLDTSLQEELHQPVIAITQSEPEGLLRELLVCLQTSIP
jgi:phosphate transport system substrate-binding protein